MLISKGPISSWPVNMCSGITSKCWAQEYGSAQEVVDNMLVVQKKSNLHVIVNIYAKKKQS